jgi:hypothetical protein
MEMIPSNASWPYLPDVNIADRPPQEIYVWRQDRKTQSSIVRAVIKLDDLHHTFGVPSVSIVRSAEEGVKLKGATALTVAPTPPAA